MPFGVGRARWFGCEYRRVRDGRRAPRRGRAASPYALVLATAGYVSPPILAVRIRKRSGGLQGVPLSAMMRATGLSLRYCSLIRRGLAVPHPRHWAALRAPQIVAHTRARPKR